jgi:NAD-specific glutamate dehydrogenase
MMDIDAVYRSLDKLNNKLKAKVEQNAFAHTMKILNNSISVVFYDLTTPIINT